MTASEDDTLFVYGTLLDPNLRERLLGRSVTVVPARLEGFERELRTHFCRQRRTGATTAGVLLLGLSDRDFRILDEYEDVPRLYVRERVQVRDESGQQMDCFVYMPTQLGSG